MIADVVEYTTEEGGLWKPWPHGKKKPSNPVLLTSRPGRTATLSIGRNESGEMQYETVHALKLDNGRVWDSINGFRDGGGPA